MSQQTFKEKFIEELKKHSEHDFIKQCTQNDDLNKLFKISSY